jgi:hypothetical protein
MNHEPSIAELRRLVADRRLAEARSLGLNLLQTFPQDIELYRVLGSMFRVIGCATDAVGAYEHLITLAPNDATAHACLGILCLLLGDYQRGWLEYEWRFRAKNFPAEPPTGMPHWDGRPFKEKTILVNAEQGLGDTVQFVRYLYDVKKRGGTVILRCPRELYSLLAGCVGVDRAVRRDDPVPPYDVETTLLSLPRIFQTSLNTIPADVPYLRVPQGAGTQAVAMITRHTEVLRVGLVWAGGIQNPNDHNRSLRLEQFGDLLHITGTKLFSLQKGEAAAQLGSISPDHITDLGPYLGDFADTAAAIQELDLIVSVDTAVAHLAGALAKPVWTLIPFAPDWRWMLDREDSPWYPTMRLFRQPAPGDWSSVIAHVTTQLTALVHRQSATDKDRNDRANTMFGVTVRE